MDKYHFTPPVFNEGQEILMLKKRNDKGVSIRKTILGFFLALIVVTVTFSCLLVFSNWLSSSAKTTWFIAKETHAEVFRQIDEFIQDAFHIVDVNQRLISGQTVDLNNEAERDKFLASVLLSQSDEIYSISYGRETGEYYGACRNEKDKIQIIRSNPQTGGYFWYYSMNENLTTGEVALKYGEFDPRTMEWYRAAKTSGGPVFSPIYRHYDMPDMMLTAAWPVFSGEGELHGVLGTHMILSGLNEVLDELPGGKERYAVVFERKTGVLVANSFGQPNYILLADGSIKRTGIEELKNTGLAEACHRYLDTGESSFIQEVSHDKLYMVFQEYSQNGLEWVVMTAVPESMLNRDIAKSIINTICLVTGLLLLSVTLCLLFVRKLSKPVAALLTTTEKISGGDLTQRVPITGYTEIRRISASFNRMADTVSALINNLEATVEKRTAELEQANKALAESKEQLQIILDSTAEAIYGTV